MAPSPCHHRAPAVSCGRVRQCWLSANSTILSSHAGPCPLAPSFRDLDCLPRTRNLETGRGCSTRNAVASCISGMKIWTLDGSLLEEMGCTRPSSGQGFLLRHAQCLLLSVSPSPPPAAGTAVECDQEGSWSGVSIPQFS